MFYGGYYNEAGRLRSNSPTRGVTAKFMSGDGSLDPGFIVASGAPGGEGAHHHLPLQAGHQPMPAARWAPSPPSTRASIGKDPGTYSSEGYDAANIFIKGVEAGNTTRAKLLDYVETLSPYDGLSKKIEFEANGNVKGGSVFVYRGQERQARRTRHHHRPR